MSKSKDLELADGAQLSDPGMGHSTVKFSRGCHVSGDLSRRFTQVLIPGRYLPYPWRQRAQRIQMLRDVRAELDPFALIEAHEINAAPQNGTACLLSGELK